MEILRYFFLSIIKGCNSYEICADITNLFYKFFHLIYVLTNVTFFALVQKLQKKYEMNKELFITINAMLDDEFENKSTDLAKVGGLWLTR